MDPGKSQYIRNLIVFLCFFKYLQLKQAQEQTTTSQCLTLQQHFQQILYCIQFQTYSKLSQVLLQAMLIRF
jgi:hypothetical protein